MAPCRPNQTYQRSVRSDKAIGNSIYHSLQLKAERRLSSGLIFLTAYTYSHSISGPSDIGGQVGGGSFIGAPQDVYDIRSDRSTSGFDVTQRFVQTVLYDIPFARHRYDRYGHQFPPRLGAGPKRQPARRPANLDPVV